MYEQILQICCIHSRDIIGSALPYEDKEAVVSNVFVALWNYSADLDTDNYSTFKPYLGTIARNMDKKRITKNL